MTRPARARGALPLWRRCLADALEPRLLLAADAAAMVKDINAVSGPSMPGAFVAFKGATYFTAQDDAHGFEWFRTDGTAAGTALLADINPGSGSSMAGGVQLQTDLVAVAGDTLFFAAYTPATGTELWKTDGTAAGTVLVKDINPGAASSQPTYLTAVGDAVFFATDDGTHRVQIWKSDGTEGGTQMLSQVSSGSWNSGRTVLPRPLGAVGGKLIFAAYGPDGREPWVTDGTAAGTVLLKNIYPAGGFSEPGFLSSGGPAQPDVVLSNGSLYFPATDRDHGRELWKTDGTPEGTVLAADVATGSTSSGPSHLTDVNGTLYFLSGPAVYRVEKATGAVNRIGALGSAAASTGSAGGVFYVAGVWADGTALLKNDPASPPAESGLTVLKQFAAGSTWPTQPFHILDAGGKALFMGPGTGDTNFHLWRSDGTPQGTLDLAGFPGQPFRNTGPVATSSWRLERGAGGLFYFAGGDALTREEPYRTDGTAAGTGRLIDLYTITGPSDPGPYVYLGGPGAGRTVFAANDGQHGLEPWVTDGTAAGTALLKDIQPGAASSFFTVADFSAPVGGRTYFGTTGSSGFGTRLWATDGTPEGTVIVRDFGTSLGIVGRLIALNGKTYFLGDGTGTPGSGTSGVWVTDGTNQGTRLIAPTPGPLGQLMPYGDAINPVRHGYGVVGAERVGVGSREASGVWGEKSGGG